MSVVIVASIIAITSAITAMILSDHNTNEHYKANSGHDPKHNCTDVETKGYPSMASCRLIITPLLSITGLRNYKE